MKKSIEELIELLPENIFYSNKRIKAFLEITKGHVYYCTRHDNRGNLSCAFVSIRETLLESLQDAYNWIQEGLESGDILIV